MNLCIENCTLKITRPAAGVLEVAHFLLPTRHGKVGIRRPKETERRSMPPPFSELRAMPSLPPDTIRKLRAEGRIENDWTSRARVTGDDGLIGAHRLALEFAGNSGEA